MTEHYQTEAAIAKVREYLRQGLSRNKILELMPDLTDRQLRSYTATIHERDKIEWDKESKESLISRALEIKAKYQKLSDVCDTIVDDEKKSPRDRMEAGKLGIACLNNIYNMIQQGPLRFNNMVTGKELEKKDGSV